MTQTEVDAQATQLYVVADKSRRLLLWVAAASVIVLLLIVAYSLNQAHSAFIGARAPIDPSLVRPKPPAGEAQTNPPAASAQAPAADIQSYLTFLQGIEQRRTQLRQSFNQAVGTLTASGAPPAGGSSTAAGGSAPQTAPGAAGSSTPSPSPNAPANPPASGAPLNMTTYQQQWLDLVRDFTSQQTPRGCEILSNNYYRLLQDYVALLGDMNSGAHTADAVSAIESQNQSKVQTDALTADQSLQQVCNSSGIAKPFQIASELAATPPAGAAPPPSNQPAGAPGQP